jgi:hypothetical protein
MFNDNTKHRHNGDKQKEAVSKVKMKGFRIE